MEAARDHEGNVTKFWPVVNAADIVYRSIEPDYDSHGYVVRLKVKGPTLVTEGPRLGDKVEAHVLNVELLPEHARQIAHQLLKASSDAEEAEAEMARQLA